MNLRIKIKNVKKGEGAKEEQPKKQEAPKHPTIHRVSANSYIWRK